MRLTVLGCWAPYPRSGGACSGYLLQHGEKNILLDCGNGSMSVLQKHVDFRRLDAVIITHFHPDHYLDLFCLRHAIEGAIRDGSRQEPVDLFVPGSPEQVFGQLAGYTTAFKVNKIIEGTNADFGSFAISFIKTVHKLETYAMLVKGRSVFGYTADTGFFPALKDFFTDCRLLLAEASVMERDKEYAYTGHLTAKQAAELGRDAGVNRLVLTHFWPEYDLEELYAEAKSVFSKVELAKEGAIYLLDE